MAKIACGTCQHQARNRAGVALREHVCEWANHPHNPLASLTCSCDGPHRPNPWFSENTEEEETE